MNEWASERMSEWMNEWMKICEKSFYTLKFPLISLSSNNTQTKKKASIVTTPDRFLSAFTSPYLPFTSVNACLLWSLWDVTEPPCVQSVSRRDPRGGPPRPPPRTPRGHPPHRTRGRRGRPRRGIRWTGRLGTPLALCGVCVVEDDVVFGGQDDWALLLLLICDLLVMERDVIFVW